METIEKKQPEKTIEDLYNEIRTLRGEIDIVKLKVVSNNKWIMFIGFFVIFLLTSPLWLGTFLTAILGLGGLL